jgi:hypothetical protein
MAKYDLNFFLKKKQRVPKFATKKNLKKKVPKSSNKGLKERKGSTLKM